MNCIHTDANQDSPSAPVSTLAETILIDNPSTPVATEFKLPKSWILPSSGLNFDQSNIENQRLIRQQIAELDIEDKSQRFEIQELLAKLNCRRFEGTANQEQFNFTEENRQIVWRLDPYSPEVLAKKCLALVSAIESTSPGTTTSSNVKLTHYKDETLNFSVVTLVGTDSAVTTLAATLYHDHFYYSPVLGALNERLVLHHLVLNGETYSEKRLNNIVEVIGGNSELNLGIPTGDTQRNVATILAGANIRKGFGGKIIEPTTSSSSVEINY